MIWKTTNVFERNIRAYLSGERRAINQGGSSSGKTWAILQILIWIGLTCRNKVISVVSETFPHLQKGAIRDFRNILGERFDEASFNKTNSVYTFSTETIIEFFSVDDARKTRGPRRDILFINECNNVSADAYEQLDIRTNEFTFLDYNPVCEFWVQSKGLLSDSKNVYIHSTYLDAKQYLPTSIVENIESRREKDPNWWQVYGLGKIGNVEGLVHPTFMAIENLPNKGVVFYGLDFGYSNDPTALIKCRLVGEHLGCDQLIYEKGLTNQQIARRFESLGIRKNYDEIYADPAEPKSIAEIRLYGYNIKSAPAGHDNKIAGIQRVNQFKQYWTKRSIDAIKEQRNWRYIEDSAGRLTNKPMDDFDHAMTARMYAVLGKCMVRQSQALSIAI